MNNSEISEPNTQQNQVQSSQQHSQELVEEIDEDVQEQSCTEKYHITSRKVGKIILLTLLLSIIAWFAMVQLRNIIFHANKMAKMQPDNSIPEFSGLDEQGYRSYYYFKEMEDMAKDNVKYSKPFDLALAKNRFIEISFNELYGLFKVIKGIQYAKNYKPFKPNSEKQEFNLTISEELLQKPYNYTEFFLQVGNQYSCASCYSFPITATIQYLYKKHLNISVKLSEQQLIDCSSEDDNINGCEKGNITKGYQYAMRVGLVEHTAYPYRSKTGGHSFPCRKDVIENPLNKKYKILGFRVLPHDNCEAIQYQLAKGNTVAAMIAAGQLPAYSSFQTTAFRNCPKQPFNHAITVVGQTGKKQWIVRNSWGSSFGQNGYFVMRGGNTCGVCGHAIVPFLKDGQ